MTRKESIFGLTHEELSSRLNVFGTPRYRADQIFSWLYEKLIIDPKSMTSIPAGLRESISSLFLFDLPKIDHEVATGDGTVKYRLALDDGEAIECVAMPDEEGGGISLCVSSQVGCSLGCVFCKTATMGLHRNLEAAEIVAQVVLMLKRIPQRPLWVNIVLMGMGEPLLNLDAVLRALEIFNDPHGLELPMRRIAISTAGIPEGIRRLFSADNLPRAPRLAISLNAPDQELRESLMPIARRHPLTELMAVLRSLPREVLKRERLTIEYVLINRVNDSPAQARKLADLLRGLRVKVNLIPYNECDGLPFESPGEAVIDAFLSEMVKAGISCTVRRSRGSELSAACGQLAVE